MKNEIINGLRNKDTFSIGDLHFEYVVKDTWTVTDAGTCKTIWLFLEAGGTLEGLAAQALELLGRR